MSETLSQDPEGLTSGYTTLTSSYPPTPATPNSTVQDAPSGAHLPPFSTFSADMDSNGGFTTSSDRLFSDARLLDISNWDYYTETRLLERGENGLSIISSQPQYRPWESKPVDSTSAFAPTTQVNSLADAFAQQNGASKLPSFQSQFQAFNDPATTSEPTLTTLTNLTPVSPNSSPGNHSLTTLNSNFHTLSAVNPRSYPLVPAPIQAREIPSIQQQFLDERHIQLYSHPTTNLTALNTSIFPPQNGAIIQQNQLISSPTVVTVFKPSEADLKLSSLQDPGLKLQNVTLHPTQFQNPVPNIDNGLYNGLDKKNGGMIMNSPTRNDFRKKERRKIRASSLESSTESDGASSNMDMGSENSGQVAAISSTAGFKNHHMPDNSSVDDISGGGVDKQVKKKRKRCGECIGCQRKDNCGDCAPCRNDKSHQICKQRRCEKLTEKKNLYGEGGFLRGESRRGRGKGRGPGSYRGRKAGGPVSALSSGAVIQSEPNSGVMQNSQTSRPSPQPAQAVHMLKPDQNMPSVQQQPMTPMPFYADPNRFATPVWQADPGQAWTQGQFIQQIPTATHTPIEGYQQYSNGIYQTSYQQPAFETNTFYTGAVQVLTNPRPPSNPNHSVQPLARPNSNYSHHTPSPVPQQPPTPQNSNQRNQYQEYTIQNQNYIPPATTPTGNVDSSQQGNLSRPSSVNSAVNVPTSNQNYSSQQGGTVFTSVSNDTFSPNANSTFANSNSGNDKPGYPQVNSNPQLVSHNSSGYPGSGMFSGESLDQHMWQQSNANSNQVWEPGQSNDSAKDKQQTYNHEQIHKTEVLYNHHAQNSSHMNQEPETNLPSDRVNLNTKIKTMILNKQNSEADMNEKKNENHNNGHFLWYSHQRYFLNPSNAGGSNKSENTTKDEAKKTISLNIFKSLAKKEGNKSQIFGDILKQKSGVGKIYKCSIIQNADKAKLKAENEPPPCQCLQPNQSIPEPGVFYTHLGCADNLRNLRKDFECKTGVSGKAIRIEKVRYTGKEGKTNQGCPIAKWILRRSGQDEKYLVIVKHRQGHSCVSAFIIICIVVWEAVSRNASDDLYNLLTDKLNKFGLPTKRRCGINDPRTCACQGTDPNSCGASFSFGCSWSMYYNGCKFTRSKFVRKFRLNVQAEEELLEDQLQKLASHITPIYRNLAPSSFKNQTQYEEIASDCRLGYTKGRPFSGVTACMDFCAHAHKDTQNMNNGCTAVVTLTKKSTSKTPPDEQLHVLPMYVVDATDEFGSTENQQNKIALGSIEALHKYSSEIRLLSVPLEPCKRKNKRKSEEGSKKNETASPKHKEPQIKQEEMSKGNDYTEQTPLSKLRNTESNLNFNGNYNAVNNGIPQYHINPSGSSDPMGPNYLNSNSSTSNHPKFWHRQTAGFYNNQAFYPNGFYNSFYSNNCNQNNPYQNSFNSYGFEQNVHSSHYSNYLPYGSNDGSAFSHASNTGQNYSAGFSDLPCYKVINPFDDFQGQNVLNSSPLLQSKLQFQKLYTDNLECFRDSEVGGVAIALEHGSLLFECAKHELHATTALKEPNRLSPTRISLVFYQHRNLNKYKHGLDEYSGKMKTKNGENDVKPLAIKPANDLLVRAYSLPTFSWTTLFPMHPCITTGPYQIIKN
ncbi:DNA N6-methyl adenine demethylase isoform X2 [Coccinella septempunctata]|uniref:DNA N6-methyl adenine demethylase isoform X2 n=1 Tax=Coccinella septempunctata TaxID=41139 RepID=UPI001D05CF97|nr:DNA N6-methyl adenine demethylase isoform X2 [Coccinella septempunctata]